MKCCKIIVAAFHPNKHIVLHNPWPYHPQRLNTPELFKEMIDKVVEIERTDDPGVDVDTYIIAHEDEWGIHKMWDEFNETPKNRGTFRVIKYTEFGGGLIAFNIAYKALRDQYDWFMFTCEDITILGENYYKAVLEKWSYNTGFVAMQGINTDHNEFPHHVHGPIGLTHVHILNKLCEANGGKLPHASGVWKQENDIAEGETKFTNIILNLGYDLVKFNDSEVWDRKNFVIPFFFLATHKE